MIKKIASISLLLLLLAYISYAVVMSNRERNGMKCEQVRIDIPDGTITPMLERDDISDIIIRNNVNPIGKPFRQISLDRIERAIEKNPIVKKAECMKMSSKTIRIRVEQRKPFIRIVDTAGGYYLDKEMVKIPTSTQFSLLLPTFTGEISREFYLQQIVPFVEELEKDNYWRDNIQQICIEEGYKVGFIPTVGNFYVKLGQLDNFTNKLSRYRTFCEKVLPIVGWDRYSQIDLQFNKQVVCKNRFEHPKTFGEAIEDQ